VKILFFDENVPYLLKDNQKPFGGAAVDLLNQMVGLRENGIEVGLLTWKGAKKHLGELEETLPFELVESYDRKSDVLFFHTIFIKFPTLLYAIWRYRPNYLTVKCPGVINGVLFFISKLLNVSFIYQLANDVEADGRVYEKLSLCGKFIYRCVLKKTDFIRCQNEYQRRNLTKKHPNKKIFVTGNSVNVSEKPTKRPFNEREYVVWIGTFRPQKNLYYFYKICHKLNEVNFKIAGDFSGESNNATKLAVEKLNKLKNVEMMGFIEHARIGGLLSKSFCLVSTSDHEGFPNTYLEAWLAGTLVVATPGANPGNVIKKYKLGLIASDKSDFVKHITKLMSNEHLYDKLRGNCDKYVKDNHDRIKVAKKFLSYLNEK